jgi:hypothetical protein
VQAIERIVVHLGSIAQALSDAASVVTHEAAPWACRTQCSHAPVAISKASGFMRLTCSGNRISRARHSSSARFSRSLMGRLLGRHIGGTRQRR